MRAHHLALLTGVSLLVAIAVLAIARATAPGEGPQGTARAPVAEARPSQADPANSGPERAKPAPEPPAGKTGRIWVLEMAAPGGEGGSAAGERVERASPRAQGRHAGADGARARRDARLPAPPEHLSLPISGRVVTTAGQPVPGIALAARRYYAEASDGSIVPWGRGERKGRSGEDGSYQLGDLPAGDYEVRTEPTDLYPSARTIVRAGADSADIVLVGSLPVRVHGTVSSARGELLAGVLVIPAHLERKTRTDDAGRYEAELIAQAHRSYAFRFQAKGYEEKRVTLRGKDVVGLGELQLNVELEAVGETAEVRGTLTSRRGDRVPGEHVQLDSKLLRSRYTATSDPDGNFAFPRVKLGSDYRLTVLPKGEYQDYERESLDIARGRRDLDVVLEPLSTGQLSGRMVDSEGNPLPDFRLWLRSTEARARSVPVASDDGGYFAVEDAPEGQLTLVTRSLPHLEVTGITLAAGLSKNVDVVLDWGEHVMTGRVLGDDGSPVSGAQLSLSWSHQRGTAHSRSLRRTLSDAGGSFRFTQLGPGAHQLAVSAPGYLERRESFEVGHRLREAELRLEQAR